MHTKTVCLLGFTSVLLLLASGPAFGGKIDIRVATGMDDVEQHLGDGDIDPTSSDLEFPYEDAGNPATDAQITGLRFVNIPIAKGTQILKAYLEFEVDSVSKEGSANPVNVIIQGELVPDAPVFLDETNNVTNRTSWTKATAKWSVPAWTAADTKWQSSDIAAVIQEIVNQAGWKSGNALVLIVKDDPDAASRGLREAESYDGESTAAPLLHIEVFNPAASSPNPPDGYVGLNVPLFQWTAGDGGVLHDVYFGTTPELTAADLKASRQFMTLYYHMDVLEPGVTYYWRVDEMAADNTVTTGTVWSFTVQPLNAYAPQPAHGMQNVFPGPVLGWMPGQNAMGHQVYFSSVLAEVEAGAAGADKGKTTETTLKVPVLRSSTTHYWRVDETQLDGTVIKGPIWSFTTEDGVTKKIMRKWWSLIGGTAVSALTGTANYPHSPSGQELMNDFEGPVDWANSYGTQMYGWLTPPESGDYTFWIASDDASELSLSTDAHPANATTVALVSAWTNSREWTKEAGQKSAPISLQAGQKYFIQALQKEAGGGDNLAVSWQGPGIAAQTILSAKYVDTFALPPLQAYSPRPLNGEVDAVQEPVLTWSAGEKATKHQVYFGDDANAVAAADASSSLFKGSQTGTSLDVGALEWNKTYYWRVDETDGSELWKGNVWSFTTANFLPVEDFEGYDDAEGTGTRIYETWIDGYTDGLSGSTVGNMDPPFAERTIVHGGRQSMPMDYNNVNAPYFSEAYREFAPVQNWTVNGVTDLSLWVRGTQAPVAAVAEVGGKMSVTGEGTDIWNNGDQFTFVYKSLNGDGSLSARVTSIGTGSNRWAKGGVMVRDGLDAGSVHAMTVLTGGDGNGASFQYRPIADAASSNADAAAAVAVPYYVKIERKGDTLNGYLSADGTNWTPQGVSQYIAMSAPAYIGICVTSHAAGQYRTFEFDNIKVTGASGSWQTKEIGLTRNSVQPLYAIVEDSAGKKATVVDPNAAAVNATTWTEWKIPLTALTGVNLTKIKKLYIGVGDKANPAADGYGRIYIDDIRVVKPAPAQP